VFVRNIAKEWHEVFGLTLNVDHPLYSVLLYRITGIITILVSLQFGYLAFIIKSSDSNKSMEIIDCPIHGRSTIYIPNTPGLSADTYLKKFGGCPGCRQQSQTTDKND
jgi:hypothetical protein